MLYSSRRAFLALAVLLAGCAAPHAAHHPMAPTTQAVAQRSPFINAKALIIVRHGDIDVEKKRTMGGAVPLTDRGQQRARELAYALKDAGINRVITSEALRTQETAAVLAQKLGLTPESPFSHGKESGM